MRETKVLNRYISVLITLMMFCTPIAAFAGNESCESVVRISSESDMPSTIEAGDKTELKKMVEAGISDGTAFIEKMYSDKDFVFGKEWDIIALVRAGKTISEDKINKYYNSVVETVKAWDKNQKPTDIERVSLALSVLGKDITDVGGKNLAEMIYNSDKLSEGSNELVFALLALDARKTEFPAETKWNRKSMIDALLKFQAKDGGFGLQDNIDSSIDITAMTLQALAPYKENKKLKKVIDAGIKYLEGQVDKSTMTVGNVYSTAQVILALSELGIDPAKGGAFGDKYFNIITAMDTARIKGKGFGDFGSTYPNNMANQQSLEAVTAYKMMLEKKSYWKLEGNVTAADYMSEVDTLKEELDNSNKENERLSKENRELKTKEEKLQKELKKIKADYKSKIKEFKDFRAKENAKKLKVSKFKVKSLKKYRFKLSWKKTKDADGYQVVYKISKSTKFKDLKVTTKTKLISKKLKKNKKYIFRIRTYKKVNRKKIYGKWTTSEALRYR